MCTKAKNVWNVHTFSLMKMHVSKIMLRQGPKRTLVCPYLETKMMYSMVEWKEDWHGSEETKIQNPDILLL